MDDVLFGSLLLPMLGAATALTKDIIGWQTSPLQVSKPEDALSHDNALPRE